jgi:hypothetical protein
VQFGGNFSVQSTLTIARPLFAVHDGVGYVLDETKATYSSLSGVATVKAALAGDSAKYTFEAANQSLGSTLSDTLSLIGAPLASVMGAFVAPLTFSSISVEFSGNASIAAKPLSMELKALPVVTQATSPLLYWVLDITGLDEGDLSLEVDADGVSFTLDKEWVFNLSKPFVNPPGGSSVDLSIGVREELKLIEVAAIANFTTGFSLPGLTSNGAPNSVAVAVQLGITYDLLGSVLALELGGQILSPIAFSRFPWVSIADLGVTVDVTPDLEVVKFQCYGDTTLLGATASVALDFDPPSGLFGFRGNLSQLDLQGALASMGVKANLGPFNLNITEVQGCPPPAVRSRVGLLAAHVAVA